MAKLMSFQPCDEPSMVSSYVVTTTWNLEKVTMPSKFQPTRGGSRKRTDIYETSHHLRDETTDSEGEIQEIGTKEPSPSYQTRYVTRKQAANPQSDEGDDSSVERSSLSGNGVDSDEGRAMRPPAVWQETLSQ
ncbi:hypothetical protein HAX54_033117 [Datura stramonium]|uniref:Uncharacterized protein n=1 Tax=Datura stramonium TaxID=4076 RepID=A0ABS8VCF4_DATST|nr:hypothetical protein [Datura stramonium]